MALFQLVLCVTNEILRLHSFEELLGVAMGKHQHGKMPFYASTSDGGVVHRRCRCDHSRYPRVHIIVPLLYNRVKGN